jgi:serralysin
MTAGTLRFSESAYQVTASAYYPADHAIGGDAMFNPVDYEAPQKGTYAYATFMHEIGHTIGLDHGQDGSRALPHEHDSLEYSVMTYRSYAGAGLGAYTVQEGGYPRSFMLSDIAALQHMYGADFTTNAGNTTYRWSPTTGELTINGSSAARSTTNKILETIWDGGGTDTYDFSAYTSALQIDLRPGAWTTTSSAQLANLGDGHIARGNIANAYQYQGSTASLIENVKGGSGNDRITGNIAGNRLEGGSGNDKLFGGAGKDVLVGGKGSDSFVFNSALGAAHVDQVKDFRHDTDRLSLERDVFDAIGRSLTKDEFYAGAKVSKAHDKSDHIIYDTRSGKLYYDEDGKGGDGAVHFATLTSKPVLDHGDFAIV